MPGGHASLSSAINARVFSSGERHSEDAAYRWMSQAGTHTEWRPYSVLFECDADLVTNVGVRAFSNGSRHWWSGNAVEFKDALAAQTCEIGAALHLALQNQSAQLYFPLEPKVMGILNVTPDSFSDGGQWLDADAAVERGLQMLADGADIVDIGGESTRPGAKTVPEEEELRRVLPVLQRLRHEAPHAKLSIDTRKASVARACLEAGANWINDVSGLAYDRSMAATVAAFPEAELVIMHSRADPQRERYSTEWTEAEAPNYDDVIADVMRDLRRCCEYAVEQGVSESQLWIDPGFGFGKTFEQNVEILKRLREFTSIGFPVLVGTSRKSSVGKLAGGLPPEERLEATAATVAACILRGAAAVRVHDVKEMTRVVRVAAQL